MVLQDFEGALIWGCRYAIPLYLSALNVLLPPGKQASAENRCQGNYSLISSFYKPLTRLSSRLRPNE